MFVVLGVNGPVTSTVEMRVRESLDRPNCEAEAETRNQKAAEFSGAVGADMRVAFYCVRNRSLETPAR
jgi:hypothetical protein